MARYVNVCALGHVPPPDAPADNNRAIQQMIDFWRAALDAVWPYEPDLVVLPECCDRYAGHSIGQRLDYYRTRGDHIRDALAEDAATRNCYVAYSAVREQADGTWRNTTELLDRTGKPAGRYWKNYVTRGEFDEGGIHYGTDTTVLECDFGTVGFAICFDLNFEELRKRYAALRPDIVAFSSVYHGGLAQRVWAYECQSYFVGAVANLRCDVLSPQGEPLASSSSYQPFVATRINLDRAVVHLDFNREKLDAAKAQYGNQIGIAVPDYLGSVLLTSESDAFSVQEVLNEFEMSPWRDYYAATEKHRKENL